MTTSIPTTPEALATFLTEDVRNKISSDPIYAAEQFANFGRKYAEEWTKTQAGQRAMADATALKELEFVQYLEDHGNELPKNFKPGQALAEMQQRKQGMGLLEARRSKAQVYNKGALGTKMDGKFANAYEFFASVVGSARPQLNFKNRDSLISTLHSTQNDIVNTYGSIVPSDGGFLIPEVLRSEILQLALESSIVRQRATVIQMDSLKVPIPAVDERSRVTNIFGGLQFFWTAEGQPGIDSSAKFGQVTLDAKKLMGYAGIPNELMMDAPAFMSWFSAKFPVGNSWFEDIAFLNGDGVTQPLGIQSGTGIITTSRTTTNKILYDDLVRMFQSLYPASMPNSCWVASHDTYQQLAELTFTPSGGTTPVPVMLWQMNAIGSPVQTVLGRPIIFTEKIGPLGSQGDIMLVDFSEYLVGDRQMMSVESSTDYLFGTDKTAFRCISRVDGRPWLPVPITPHNNSTVLLSPYVLLHA